MITAEVVRDPQCIESLRSPWERLYAERASEPSTSWAWSRAILRNHLAGSRDWFTVVLRRNAEVAAIIPMMATRVRVLGNEIVALTPIQEQNNTHSDLLIGADGDLLGAWLDELDKLEPRWDLLSMSRLLDGSPLLRALESELTRRRQPFHLRAEQPSYHLRLPSTFEEYLAARSGKFRSHLKRADKRLAASGEVAFEVVESALHIGDRFDELLAIERGSWKHEHGTAISAVPHQAGFYRDLSVAAADAGMLHLSFLRLGGVAVAYNLGLIARGRYYYLKTSYLKEFREHGVATIGRARLIRELIGRGIRDFDFPAEPYEWERQWTDEARWHRSLQFFNRGLRGRLLWLVSALRNRTRRRHAGEIVHSDARALRATES
jgi:CelD/BcsL family acetyltransferase involved in cellulose biosynthesis